MNSKRKKENNSVDSFLNAMLNFKIIMLVIIAIIIITSKCN